MRRALLALLCVPPLFCPSDAQSLRVYSEFAQFNSSGDVAAPEHPREILSPAIVRNGFTSFQIVVQVEPGTPYTLYVGQNPEDAVHITVYRESPLMLEPIGLPFESKTTQVFWMDVWTGRDAPVRRIKIEPQVNVNRDWMVYPMEARVMEATVPAGKIPEVLLPPEFAMRSFLCGPQSVFSLAKDWNEQSHRNAQQDLALARQAPKAELLRLLGGCDAAPNDDPESYLKIRDYLFRMR